MFKYPYCLFFLFCIFSNHLLAQELQVDVQKHGTEDGLSHRDALCLHRDALGFIWIGTKSGLNRFDGHNFQWFTKEKNGLASNEIDYIAEDSEGWFWLFDTGGKDSKTPKYVTLFHPITKQVESLEGRFGNSLPFKLGDVLDFKATANKRLIFITIQNEIIAYWPNKGFAKNKIACDQSLASLNAESENLIWGLAKDNISRMVAFDWKGRVLLDTELAKDRVVISKLDAVGDKQYFIWRKEAGFMESDLYEIDTAGNTKNLGPYFGQVPLGFRKEVDEKIGNGPIFSYRHPSHSAFFLKSRKFLFLIDRVGGWGMDLTMDYPELATPNEILYLDENLFCIGTPFGMYLLNVKKNTFKRYLHTDPTSRDFIKNRIECREIIEVAPDVIWANTYKGTWSILEDGTTEPAAVMPAVLAAGIGNLAHGLFKDSRDNIWIGIRQPIKYEMATGALTLTENPSRDDLWTMFEDGEGTLWMSFDTHLDFMSAEGSGSIDASLFPGFGNAFVIHFHEDKTGKVWLASQKGLFILDAGKKRITERYWTGGSGQFHLPVDDIYHIHEDEQGDFWLATNGAGLVHWKKQTDQFEQYIRTDGLSDNVLYAVYEDGHNNLWMSSNRGITRFNKETKKISTFLEEDGTLQNEYNRTSHFQSADGTIYFGGINGLTVFHPDDILEDEQQNPPVAIVGFTQFDGKSTTLVDRTVELRNTRTIWLRPDDRFFNLEFSLLSYNNQPNVRYAYRFDGLGEDWNYMRENRIRIGRLPYGDYTLRVKGQTSRGHWSEKELALQVRVTRPYYMEVWFVIMSGLLFMGVLFGLYKWRSRQYKLGQRQLKEKIKTATQQIQEDKQTIEKQAAELRQLDQAKSRFFANVSHELRTPLTLILGPIQAALKNDRLDQRTQKWLRTAQGSGQQLLQLVNSLLDFSKLDAAKLELVEEPVFLKKELSVLAAQFNSHAEGKHVRFGCQTEALADHWLMLDWPKLKTILNNLLSNAIKFTEPDGQVSLECWEENDHIVIQVADTGRGIHADDLPNIFKRFYQSRHQSRIAEGGTGIGLALSKELAGIMGGELSVESPNPASGDKGSIFRFSFPKKTAPGLLAEDYDGQAGLYKEILLTKTADSSNRRTGGKPKPALLVVEDHDDLRKYISDILSEKYAVRTAVNGKEALRLLRPEGQPSSKLPSLILSDIMMPLMDGFELLERVRKDDDLKQIPLILLTARADLSDKLNALRIGVDDYLVKPFAEEELLARIDNLLANYHRRQQYAPEPEEDDSPALSAADQEWLEAFEALVKKELPNNQITITWLAAQTSLSQRQLNRKLQKLLGLSGQEYLREHRLRQARSLLETGRYRTVALVAYAVGYDSPRAFSRAFQERFGRLPSSYF